MSKLKSIPAFKTETEERKFWETHDSTDYINWSKAERVRFPNLKPSTTAISIRLPLGLLEQIKIAANVLVSEQCSREIEGLWLREPKQFLHDALPRARTFLDKFGDIRCRLTASASCTSAGAG